MLTGNELIKNEGYVEFGEDRRLTAVHIDTDHVCIRALQFEVLASFLNHVV